ncbi:hypothetical protein PG994_014166 [Apiospora phragmitis]|uniref:Wings apart-like protein C-terminal domain-containing protein n=1 Tax=Apiospora phragmitis TaxID=2905665 RepID=A0ABR1T3K6_9PEZI
MATRDAGNRPKKPIATYGKRKSQTARAFYAGAKGSTRPSDRQVASGSITGQTTRPGERDPYELSSSPEPLSVNAPARQKPAAATKSATVGLLSSERKRKVAELYSPKALGQDPLTEGDDSSPVRPTARRSRISSPEPSRPAKQTTTATRRPARSTSGEGMDVDTPDVALSSPPPTPAVSKSKVIRDGKAVSKRKEALETTFPPQTMEAFGNLAVTDKGRSRPRMQQQIPVRLAQRKATLKTTQSDIGPTSTSTFSASLSQPAAKGAAVADKPPKRQKPRLIDSLKAQIQSSDESEDDGRETQVTWSQPLVSGQNNDFAQEDSQDSMTLTPNPRKAPGTRPPAFSRTSSQVKRTYGQTNSLLEETDMYAALELPHETPALKGRRLEYDIHKKLIKPDSDDEDADLGSASKTAKMQGIHELRAAGANTFVADQMHDLTDQIGAPNGAGQKPSSSRRTALRQVADKVKEKEYRRSLRDHGVEATIFGHADREHDTITGYFIVVILLQLLAHTDSPHIVRLVRTGDMGALFARLLAVDDDTLKLARDRKSNLSKRDQTLLAGLQNGLKELSAWRTKPAHISPRTATLKCLQLLVAQDPNIGMDLSLLPATVTDKLFSVLSGFLEAPDAIDRINVFHALSVLEYHTVKALEFQNDSNKWLTDYLPSVADAFGAVLRVPHDTELESLVMRVMVNLVETVPGASEVFVAKGLLPTLASSVCASFAKALATVSTNEWSDEVRDGLVLRLGILINCAERSVAVREAVWKCYGDDGSPTNKLIKLFLENHASTAEADSDAKSQLNVAFGYLAVLLGYLSLLKPFRVAFRASHSKKNMRPLLDSIREFVVHHKVMEAALKDAVEGDGQEGYTDKLPDKLQLLVEQIENESAFD